MIKNKIIGATLFAMLNGSCFAGMMGYETAPYLKKGIALNVGPAWSDPGRKQTIYFSPTFPQTYVANSNTNTLGSGEVFLFFQKDVWADLQAQLGLSVAATTNIHLKGDIWLDDDPDFNNFAYSYKIKHTHVAVRGKLYKEIRHVIAAYLGASIGVGFNHAYHYLNVPKLPEMRAEPPFPSNNNKAFTYTLDVGIHKNINECWAIEIGYEFMDWGKTYLDRAVDQSSGIGLNLNHVYTNALQVGLSFTA